MAEAMGIGVEYEYTEDDAGDTDGGILHLKRHLHSYPMANMREKQTYI